MGRRPAAGTWGLRPVTDCLHQLAYTKRGIHDPDLHRQTALLDHPAIETRIRRGLGPSQALEEALLAARDFRRRPELLSNTQYEAVLILLAARARVAIGGTRRVPLGAAERAEYACRVLGGHGDQDDVDRFRDGHGPRGRKRSAQSDLLDSLAQILDVMDPSTSASDGLARTPASGSGTTGTVWADLLGTWQGVTVSDSLFKDRAGEQDGVEASSAEEGRFAPCFMVIERQHDEFGVRWLYRAGLSTAIAVRPVLMPGGGRRLICVYDADRFGTEALHFPSHRGACLLEVDEDPAITVVGPYWNDRPADGLLLFERRLESIAETFNAADALPWPSRLSIPDRNRLHVRGAERHQRPLATCGEVVGRRRAGLDESATGPADFILRSEPTKKVLPY